MTTLEITPKIADKTARFKGTVAAGEHVAVTIKGGAEWLGDDNGAHLSLRVIDFVTGRTLAVFPRPPETLEEGEDPDEWSTAGEDDTDLFCNLNLNTDRMVNAARHMLRVPVLFVMGAKDDENPATTRTLYFRDRYEVEFWPERVGDDTPYDLDRWPKQIDEWTELVAEFGTRLTTAETNISRAESRVDAAIDTIPQTVETAVTQSNSGKADKVANATNGNLAALAANGNLDDSGKKPSDFADAVQFANHKDNTDIHFTAAERAKLNGVAAGAQVNVVETVKRNGVVLPVTGKAVNVVVPTKTSDLQNDGSGDGTGYATVGALNAEKSRATGAEDALAIRATALESTSASHSTQLSQMSQSKADKLTTYTKAETDALVSGAVSGVFVVAQSLPATGETNKIYLVPKSGGETGDVRDEYVWVNGAWEIIGSTRVDLSDYYDKTAADGRFVQKEAGKGLSANDYTTAEKQKLGGVEAEANKTVVDSALSYTSTNPVQNKVVTEAVSEQITRLDVWTVVRTENATGAVVDTATLAASSELMFRWDEGSNSGYRLFYFDGEWTMYGRNSQISRSVEGGKDSASLTFSNSVYTWTWTRHGSLKAMLNDVAAALALKADAASLPYALVTVTPTAGAPFVLAACFPIKYTYSGSTVEITADDANIGILDDGESGYTIEYNAETIFFCSVEGIYVNSAVDGLTFGTNEDTPDSSTQVLGFTQTAQLIDRASAAVSLTADATLAFPAQTAGKARDFVVRLTLTETNDVVPSVTFPADVAYEAEGGEWPDLTEAGTYIVRLTEVPTASESETARFFLQCSSAVADATPPSAGGGQ